MKTRLNTTRNNKNQDRILNLFVLAAMVIIIAVFTNCYRYNSEDFCENEHGIKESNKTTFRHLKTPVNYTLSLEKLMDSLQINSSGLYILIDKSDYVLAIMKDTLIIKQYPVVLGRNPVDDKLREGDCCTPEGSFKILAKYNHEIWTKFIWIDYPNKESLRKFREAKNKGIIPLESTPGGEIGIHGVPTDADFVINQGENWTAGCISLKNRDVIEIFNYVDIGTEVIIRK